MNTDEIGNALRKYYYLFGVENEGPPRGLNVSKLFHNINFDTELQLIDRIVNNRAIVQKHQECLYLSSVYMKKGPLLKILKETAKNKKPVSQLALQLIRRNSTVIDTKWK